MILDDVMPGVFGADVCRELRAESDVPIILMSDRDTELHCVLGLEFGADDYVVKPFSMAELVARFHALLRRRRLDRVGGGRICRAGDIEIDLAGRRVTVAGTEVRLTRSEFRVLQLLAEEPERVYSRREIMDYLWDGAHYAGDDRASDIHVANLRQKIEDDPRHPERLVTVGGEGYALHRRPSWEDELSAPERPS